MLVEPRKSCQAGAFFSKSVWDRLDADGHSDAEELVVRATIVKASGRLAVDLSGSSRQARTCINAGPLDSKTAVGAALKILFDRESPFTSGTLRHVDVVVPPGTVLSAMPPDGAIMLYWEVTQALLCGILRELGKAVGELSVGGDYGAMGVHNAHGFRADGTPWANIATAGGEHGPWGADKDHDGILAVLHEATLLLLQAWKRRVQVWCASR